MEHHDARPRRRRRGRGAGGQGEQVENGAVLLVVEPTAADDRERGLMSEPDPHRQLLGLLRRPPLGRPGDGRGRPDRRAHRRLARRAHDADPRPHPGQAARRRLRPHLRHPDGAGDGHLPRPRASRSCPTRAASTRTAAPRPSPRWPSGSGCRPPSPTSTATTSCRGSASSSAAGVDLAHFETGEPIGDTSRFVTANAYLGCWGIVEALARGADIVVTGRTTDAAVVCGPAAWHHGWARDDWDALAGARRRRPRHRVRHAGHRRQLLVLHRGAGHDPHRLPVGRDRRRRLVGDRQARRHRRRGVDRHGHLAAALRDRRPGVPRPRRHRPVRHDPSSSRSGPTACASTAPGASRRRPRSRWR